MSRESPRIGLLPHGGDEPGIFRTVATIPIYFALDQAGSLPPHINQSRERLPWWERSVKAAGRGAGERS
jgi:hypothetical protein